MSVVFLFAVTGLGWNSELKEILIGNFSTLKQLKRLMWWLQEPVCTAYKLMMVVWQLSHILPAMWSAWVQMNVCVCGNVSRGICSTQYNWLVLTESYSSVVILCQHFISWLFVVCSWSAVCTVSDLEHSVQCKFWLCALWYSQSLHMKNLHSRKIYCHELIWPWKWVSHQCFSIWLLSHCFKAIWTFHCGTVLFCMNVCFSINNCNNSLQAALFLWINLCSWWWLTEGLLC